MTPRVVKLISATSTGSRPAGATKPCILGIALLLGALLLLALIPATAQAATTVTYRTVNGITLRMDIYGTGDKPSLLLVHGGAYKAGDKSDMSSLAQSFATDGFVVYVPNYRLACAVGGKALCIGPGAFPEEPNDVRAASRWVRDHSAQPSHLAALGLSAGGNLVYMTATTGSPDAARPEVVAGWSGSTDMKQCSRSADPGVCVSRANYLGCSYQACPETWDQASPLSRATSLAPPTFIANSEDELIPLTEGSDFASRLTSLGVLSRLVTLPGSRHAGAYETDVYEDTLTFLKSHV